MMKWCLFLISDKYLLLFKFANLKPNLNEISIEINVNTGFKIHFI